MKAIVLNSAGSVDNLVLTDLPVPVPAEAEVLVKVKAISINPVDVKTRAGNGRYNILKEENPLILGWDISGVVVASNSPLFKENDEVFGMVNFPGHGRAYAEYVAAPAAHLALKPANISHEEAAAATLAALTAWQALIDHASIRPGQKVLIHAAAGGVGHYAVQLAKRLGAYVIGTSSAANKDVILGLGADEHIDYHNQRLTDHVPEVDFVLDTIGGDTIDQSLEVMKPGATIISIPSGFREAVTAKAEAKGMIGFFILVASNGAEMASIAALMEQGLLRSIVSKTFSLEEMKQAHLQIETGRTVGKIIVRV
ncbi:NADPH:quinone reductase [Chitinophaga ginsengisegetis]|uniref:NADPH:quinone reductase n=1 Tax=Chitinophaga ginsengisegetis TaxID=393003 RepID=A0A1T5NDC8_9BACT|nr:NADP-dependent oxidoreductase [Chitinophaga ginsengisegetis]SKC98456.1 NADPH:quinone reductase [Chitinophaga ginsengisegetis]